MDPFWLILPTSLAMVGFWVAYRLLASERRSMSACRLAESRTQAILDAAVDGIVLIDDHGRIEGFNPAAERIFGYSRAEVLGRNVRTLMPEPYRSHHDGYLKSYLNTNEPKIIGIGREVEGLRKDGSVFPLYLAVGESRIAGRRLFAGIVRDITERRRAEEALRRAKEEAERANVAKSKFLASASHDLRQPVQALVFFASALESRIGSSPAAAVLSDMKGSLEALNALLDALLDVSRLDAGIVVPRATNFSLSGLFDRMTAEYAPLAADKNLTLRSAPTSMIIRADPTLLGRMVANLMSNAVRHTERGRILLGVRRRGRRARIEVWDTGIGIPADRLTDIFQEFVQVGNGERDRAKGLGLGLAIVQRLSLLLSCPVGVRSVPGRGSVFWIDVPMVGFGRMRAPPAPETVRASSPPAREAGVVLLIDDEIMILKSLEMVIRSWGYDVLAAMGEVEAMDLLAKAGRSPDIIIADYRLREGRTGAEAILHIRDRFNRLVPAIIVTGDTAPERLREAEAYGLGLLHKPIQTSVLQTVLSEHVQG